MKTVYVLLSEYNECLESGDICYYYESLEVLLREEGEDAEWIRLEIVEFYGN